MKKFFRGAPLLLLVFVVSCAPEKQSAEKLFDFESLVSEQASRLSQRKLTLEKITAIDAHASDTTYVPTMQGWIGELEQFRQLEDVNKTIYRSEYKIEDSLKDTKSNLKVRQYSALSEKVPVSVVRFYYHRDFSQLKKIEATIQEDNILYANKRVLVLEFEDHSNKPVLHHYAMNGFQKMILRDSVHFSLEGQIN